MTPLWQWSARAVAAAVGKREIGAREIASAALARLHAVNPQLNAVIGYEDAWTLAQADAVDRRPAQGETLPMAGVPVTVKDNLWVQGRRITQGSMLFADFVAPADAWAVARLKALGAVIVGITNCSEFACKGVSNNLLYGKTFDICCLVSPRNDWIRRGCWSKHADTRQKSKLRTNISCRQKRFPNNPTR